jgi:hypothetical protein
MAGSPPPTSPAILIILESFNALSTVVRSVSVRSRVFSAEVGQCPDPIRDRYLNISGGVFG